MKGRRIPGLAVFMSVICVSAVSVSLAVLAEKDELARPSCRYCGVDRSKFAHSRFFITCNDGTILETYSPD